MNDPMLGMLSELPHAEPDRVRADRVRARCHDALAASGAGKPRAERRSAYGSRSSLVSEASTSPRAFARRCTCLACCDPNAYADGVTFPTPDRAGRTTWAVVSSRSAIATATRPGRSDIARATRG